MRCFCMLLSGAEGGGEVYLTRLPEQPLKAWPRGRPTCHETCGIPDFSQEIRDLYHSVYLMRRSPGPLPCGPQQRREAIWDILSSLKSSLHWWVYPIAAKEDTWGAVTESSSRPRGREDPHEEVLWEARAACQRALEAAQVLESEIERLSQGLRDVQCAHPCSHSGSHPWSQSLDRWPRSPDRPWQERRVTFWEPEVEPDPEERPYRGALGGSSRIFPERWWWSPAIHPQVRNCMSPREACGLPECQR